MTIADRAPDLTREPPVPTSRVLALGLVGVGISFLAFLMGILTSAPLRGFEAHWADGPRVLVSVFGLLVCGCAVSLRPGWYGGWLCGSAAALIAYGFGAAAPSGTEWYLAPPRNWYAGVPNSWDSMHIFFGVSCVIGLVGAIWNQLPAFWLGAARLFGATGFFAAAFTWLSRNCIPLLILVGVAFHFSAILSAITSPPPTPWLTDQYWQRISRPYCQFAYMNNAYQFYSPDPGPARELWACVEYRPLQEGESADDPVSAADLKELELSEDPNSTPDCTWFYIPKREVNYKDPLGLTFYRHLSVSENVAQYVPRGYVPFQVEQDKALSRRTHEPIPRMLNKVERPIPNDLVSRQILPSYARHLAHACATPGKMVKSVRIYCVTHDIASLAQLHGVEAGTARQKEPMSPYNPSLYLPYYQGRFARDGRLVDPTDPMLYWLVPIIQDAGRDVPLDRAEYRRNGGYEHYFTDYVSRHAGCKRPIKE
jgi:hypothetical protein